MKTKYIFARTTNPNTLAKRLKTACSTRMLPLLLLLMLPVAVQALDYDYVINDNGTVTITAYNGSDVDVIIPDHIYGRWVTGIGGSVFYYYNPGLNSVTIPNSVTNIGEYSFAGNPSLSSVAIPNAVTRIGDWAFSDDTGLSGFTIPNNVTSIESSTFADDTGLISVTIGKNVTNIGDNAFGNCPNLTGVYFRGNVPGGGDLDLFTGDDDAIAYYLPNTTGWDQTPTFAELPTVLWNPQMQTKDGSFGVRTNQFGFNITGISDSVIVVVTCTNLANPVWVPVQTNTLTDGSAYFSDPAWKSYPRHYYRLCSP
jgi:hypothetical protein